VTPPVLVTGAGGLVGTHVLAALQARGERPRALIREHSRATVAALGAEPFVGDVTDAGTWERATKGVRAIVHAAALVYDTSGTPDTKWMCMTCDSSSCTRTATSITQTVDAAVDAPDKPA